jgi:hypothetical protein
MKTKNDSAGKTGVSNEAVLKATGKGWNEWIKILDKAGSIKKTHKEVAQYLTDNFEISGWWAQSVTVYYEQAKGLREKHQKPGGFEISASKTVIVPLPVLYNAWKKQKNIDDWTNGKNFQITKTTENKSIRAAWNNGSTRISIDFYEKGEDKSQIALQHMKLKNSADAEKMKKFWRDVMERMKLSLEK